MSNENDQTERERAISFLISMRDDVPLRAAALGLPNRMTGEQARISQQASKLSSALFEYGAELRGRSDEEIFALEREARAQQEQRRIKEEAKLHFNQPNARADVSYWSVWPDWSIEQGIALVLDRDPRVVTFDQVKSYAGISSVAKLFVDLMALAEHTRRSGRLKDRTPPGEFLRWIDRTKLVTIPQRLLDAVAAHGIQLADWQDVASTQREAFEQCKATLIRTTELVTSQRAMLQALTAERDALLAEVTQLRDSPTGGSSIGGDTMDARERESHQKLIGALLQMLQQDTLSGRPLYPSQARIREAILINHQSKFGLGDRNLQEMFARANEAIAREE